MRKLTFTIDIGGGRSAQKVISVPDYQDLDEEVAVYFGAAMAEAQLWEGEFCNAIVKDFSEFYNDAERQKWVEKEILEYLLNRTIGQSEKILNSPISKKDRYINKCLGFKDMLKFIWNVYFKNDNFEDCFIDAKERRDKLAHDLLSDVINGRMAKSHAIQYCSDSIERFIMIRQIFLYADNSSSMFGSIMPNGEGRARFELNPKIVKNHSAD